MQKKSNSRTNSHAELVELAESLMSRTSEAESFLPAYDAALSSENDLALVNLCHRLSTLELAHARRAA